MRASFQFPGWTAASGRRLSPRRRPNRRRPEVAVHLIAVLALFTLSQLRAQAPAPAPAHNWVLPLFTDQEGYRSMTLRGSEVRRAGDDIAVTNLNITIFSGDEKAQVDSILLSPRAVFSLKKNRASGDDTVRFIRDDIEATGTGWNYDHATKKISLQHNVRVVFSAPLKDILK